MRHVEKRRDGDAVALSAFALAFAAALVLAGRRLAGGFPAPASAFPAVLAALAACGFGLALAARRPRGLSRVGWAVPTTAPEERSRQASVGAAPPTDFDPAISAAILQVPALLVGLALIPARQAGAIAALALLIVLSGYAAWRLMGGSGLQVLARRIRRAAGAKPPRAPAVAGPSLAAEFSEDPSLVQWLRRRSVDGAELIEGGLRVEFRAGQKQTSVHAPFVPPLAGIPAVECCAAGGGPSLRLKVGAVHTWGLRLDARRTEAIEEPATSLVRFSARLDGAPWDVATGTPRPAGGRTDCP
ncbi:MAG: hypothetical protein WD069_04175 [Planctomycetales bacterium]